MAYIQQALSLRPAFFAAFNNLGLALRAQGVTRRGDCQLSSGACVSNPIFMEAAPTTWAMLWKEQGKLEEAVATFRELLRLRPDIAEAHTNLGVILKKPRQSSTRAIS